MSITHPCYISNFVEWNVCENNFINRCRSLAEFKMSFVDCFENSKWFYVLQKNSDLFFSFLSHTQNWRYGVIFYVCRKKCYTVYIKWRRRQAIVLELKNNPWNGKTNGKVEILRQFLTAPLVSARVFYRIFKYWSHTENWEQLKAANNLLHFKQHHFYG